MNQKKVLSKQWRKFIVECCTGNLVTAKELYSKYNFNKIQLCEGNHLLFTISCCNDMLDIAKWLNSIIDYTNYPEVVNNVLFNIIINNNSILCTEIWLINTFIISKNKIFNILKKICESRDTSVSVQDLEQIKFVSPQVQRVKLLCEKFSFSKDELIFDKNICFINSCINGNLKVAQYINSICNFTKDEIIDNNCAIIFKTYNNGHYEVVKWLKDTWNITPDDLKLYFNGLINF